MNSSYGNVGNLALKHSDIIRGPFQLAIDITNKCNFRCLHCYNSSGENNCVDDEMTDHEFQELIEDLSIIKPLNVCICGGEPLLRKELVIESIKRLANCGINCSMVTNGYLVTEEIMKKLKEAGLKQLQVSIDGNEISHEKLRLKKGSYKKAIQTVKCSVSENIRTGVSFAPTRWNVEEFENVFYRLMSLDVTDVRVQQLMITGRGEKNKKELLPTSSQYRSLVKTINRLREECEDVDKEIFLEWGDPIEHLINFSTRVEKCCPYINIKANGAIAPSTYIPLSVGNVRNHLFSEYWEKGLARVWMLKKVQELSEKIQSIGEMGFYNEFNAPVTFIEKDIECDFIDDLLYEEVRIG